MRLSGPGACLREATTSVVGALATTLRRPYERADRAATSAGARLVAFATVSVAASALSMPSIVKTTGLGLAVSLPDLALILLGVVLAVDAWRGLRLRSLPLRAAYAGVLIFAAPLVLVRALA